MGVEVVTDIPNSIYDTGQISEQMAQFIFIALPKKPGATVCGKFKSISLMSQLSKLLSRIILNRLRNKIEVEIAEKQF